jgi:Rrf2 family protein
MKAFLKVPQKVHHGLLLMTALARAYRLGQAVSLDTVAVGESLSQGFLEEIAANLRRAGLIVSRRGKNGGYLLSRAPRQMTIGEIIAALEGPMALVECLGAQSGCPRAGSCSNETVWRRVQGEVNRVLDGLTLAKAAGLAAPRRTKTV